METQILLSVLLLFCGISNSLGSSLKQVLILFRHGARTPLQPGEYIKDPYYNYSYEPYGLGQLTHEGKKQGYELGLQFRKRYNDLLGATYLKETQKLYSSSMSRVRLTALCVMAALWKPSKEEQIVPGLDWQPVEYEPHSYYPTSLDDFGVVDQEFLDGLSPYFDVIEYIIQNSGISTYFGLMELYSTLTSQVNLGLAVPDWTKSIYPDPLDFLSGYIGSSSTNSPQLKKIGCNLLFEMITNMESFINRTTKTKAWFYAGHDLNIIAMLECLNIYENRSPKYVANLALELHELEESGYGVRVVYQEALELEPKVFVLKDCKTEKCPFVFYKSLIEKIKNG